MRSISTAKLIAFALAVCVLGLVPFSHYEHFQSAGLKRSLSQAPALLPERIGDFSSTERWSHPLARYAGIEQGATYRDTKNLETVQYDMWLGNLDARHNGIACYLSQGSQLIWQKSQTIKASDSDVVFGLALLRDDSVEGPKLKLVAASQCSFAACREDTLVARGWEFSGQSFARFFEPTGISLPLSVTISGSNTAAAQTELQNWLTHFVQGLALRPVQAFSALESGITR